MQAIRHLRAALSEPTVSTNVKFLSGCARSRRLKSEAEHIWGIWNVYPFPKLASHLLVNWTWVDVSHGLGRAAPAFVRE